MPIKSEKILENSSPISFIFLSTILVCSLFQTVECPKMRKSFYSSSLTDFCLQTSCHGLPNMVRSNSIKGRVFWFLTFAAGLLGSLYFVASVFTAFINSPTATLVDIEEHGALEFPDLLLCRH